METAEAPWGISADVDDETLARLEALARETGRSSEQLAGEALKQYVEYESWKADKIRDALRRANATLRPMRRWTRS